MKAVDVVRAAGGATRWATLQAAGVTARSLTDAVACGEIVKVCYGTYALPRADASIVAAVRSNGFLWRESAAEFWKLDVLRPAKEPHIVVPADRKRRPATRGATAGERTPLTDREVHVVRRDRLTTVRIPWPVTTVERTVVDCARVLPFADALVVLDSGLRNGMISSDRISELAQSLRGRGSVTARRVLTLGDRRSASIGETLVRASALEAGLPPPELQHKVTSGNGFLAYLDLAWPSYRGRAVKLAVEFDGFTGHGKVDFVKDRRRHNTLVAAGWTRLVYTLPDTETYYPQIGRQIFQVIEDRFATARPSVPL